MPFAQHIRHIILEQSYRAHVGHIGSALSVADIIAALYDGILRLDQTETQDRFILSKGHAALALYAALALKGIIPLHLLNTYCADDSLLNVHPEHQLAGIDFSTGSLGMGLSIGAGIAYGARLQQIDRRAFVLLSDAECNEGSVWEAAMFAAHQGLSNLIAFIDLNGQQALGHTNDVLRLPYVDEVWRNFGWDVHSVDGHDIPALQECVHSLNTTGKPHLILAKTTFGKGVSYMENKIAWHYLPMSAEQYHQALAEIGFSS